MKQIIVTERVGQSLLIRVWRLVLVSGDFLIALGISVFHTGWRLV